MIKDSVQLAPLPQSLAHCQYQPLGTLQIVYQLHPTHADSTGVSMHNSGLAFSEKNQYPESLQVILSQRSSSSGNMTETSGSPSAEALRFVHCGIHSWGSTRRDRKATAWKTEFTNAMFSLSCSNVVVDYKDTPQLGSDLYDPISLWFH